MNELEPNRELLDKLGQELKLHERAEIPVIHRQTPGLYIREVFIAKGTVGVSMRHLTEHPFVVSKGKILVITEGGEKEVLEAPYTGITTAGTRRALHALEDTIWTTFHPTEETDIETICSTLIETDLDPQLNQWAESNPKKIPCHSSQ